MPGSWGSASTKKNGGADRKQWLSIWAHQGLTVDRVTKEVLHIPRPFVAITGGIQPEALKDLDPEEGMRDGFLHRLLLVEPEAVTITYKEEVVTENCKVAIGTLFGQLYELAVDPSEKNNLWDVKPGMVKTLLSMLEVEKANTK